MDKAALAGKVALVTGGSRGIGREIAVGYARAGAKAVVVTAAAASDETRGEIDRELAETVALIEAAGSKALALQADVCSRDDCDRVVRETEAAFGALDILVNNAGKSPRYHGPRGIPFWETEPDGFRLVIDTNVVGPYLMARAAVPGMIARGWGRIIGISKGFDAMHEAHTGAYGPSKAALEAESLSWAEELADTGVTVNVVAPGGPVATRFGRGKPTDRGMAPTVMVPCMVWLASPAADGINGCRYVARNWDENLADAEAAEGCREAALFRRPAKPSRLDRTWEAPETAAGRQGALN